MLSLNTAEHPINNYEHVLVINGAREQMISLSFTV